MTDTMPVGAADTARVNTALRFTAVIIMVSLLFQRFGVMLGGISNLDAVAPLGAIAMGSALLGGTLAFHRARLTIWLLILMWIVLDCAVRAAVPSPYGGGISWTSLGGFLTMNSMAIFQFAKPVDERAFFNVVNRCFAVIAIFGLIQFFVQFAGISVFQFTGPLPASFLVESAWNVAIPISGTNYFKANGFFLLEPSIFSQFMALALLIEILVMRRPWWLALFGAAMMVSFSGTGWLMIVAFVASAVASMGKRGVGVALATVLLGGMLILALYFLAPGMYAMLSNRFSEFQMPGTSGHDRFVTPWWMVHDALSFDPLTWLFGMGPGYSEHPSRYVYYEYTMNPPAKLLLEYGLPVLIMYFLLLVSGRKSVIQRALLAPVLVMILFDGGYEQAPFILFPTMLICLVGNLKTDEKLVRGTQLVAHDR